ncbi:MAG TPA: UDP-glucose/GDP-mannose dehydrogenase family protein [Bradyrhizobium sp.]|nr:UDP-glucose/GDP-mannose dehydrogenase family protein [Bradyrhizobium sp.]
MRLAVLGTGYVGLVSAACFAHAGQHVTCVDIDEAKIALLRRGEVPIYEPELEELIADGRRRRRLHFTCDPSAVTNADIVFIAVGTPARASDGHADLSQVFMAAEALTAFLKSGTIVVTKSTVPVGTGDTIEDLIRRRCPDLEVEVASNPEFLRAGRAVQDFLQPDRVVIGAQSDGATARLMKLYRSVGIERDRILVTDRRSSELIKYAANGFLATKIAFINEVAELCEKVDARIGDVTRGVGLDERIGTRYLSPGPGFGGSCFPKDARALAKMGEDHEAPMRIIETVLAANEARKRSMARKVAAIFGGSVRGKTIALLGLTFKADTDDMRDAVSIPLAHGLSDAGSILKAYDPVANGRARTLLPRGVQYCSSAVQAAEGADAIVIVTEWQEFTRLDFRKLRAAVRTPVIIDLRNLLNEEQVRLGGFRYLGIGGQRRHALDQPSSSVRPSRLLWADAQDTRPRENAGQQRIAAAE